ncbi:hypothetical protein E4U40_001250 [Claviceps sp. LM458 group G5]|nr:hypothetical protein E4U40_001250 [Claviceps sp. LM458 group G5]
MSSSASDAMDVASSPTTHSHELDMQTNGQGNRPKHPPGNGHGAATPSSSNMPAPSQVVPSSVHHTKVVQTAFIHKLYNMLEDSSIQHLISWTPTSESFVMSPTADFSKVLSLYFKHTNISSFVRQLNMYGFHKERDVFHSPNPDSTMWEFKHGNGSFKRGDIAGLRDIKRRASRHSLVHREPNYPKPGSSQPGLPADPIPPPPESVDARLANLEHMLYDMSARLQRSEENAHYLHMKNQATLETFSRLLSFNQELSRAMLTLLPPDSAAHRDVITIQGEMQKQAGILRSADESYENQSSSRQSCFGTVDNGPISPRQLPLARGQLPQHRSTVHPSMATLSAGPRRPYGSIGGNSTTSRSSSPPRNAAVPPPPGAPHPLSNVETPPERSISNSSSLARRHTAADISAHGWQPGLSPFPSSSHSAIWPSPPGQVGPEGQRIRESFSNYSMQTALHPSHALSRPSTPPLPPTSAANGRSNAGDAFDGWSWTGAGSTNVKSSVASLKDSSAPPTRRGSMAHILNPSETAERSDDEGRDDVFKKRRRI